MLSIPKRTGPAFNMTAPPGATSDIVAMLLRNTRYYSVKHPEHPIIGNALKLSPRAILTVIGSRRSELEEMTK